jgi:hypothetical protein
MSEWLKLVDSGDREALTKFVAEHYAAENLQGRSAEQIAQGQLHFAGSMRGLS